MRKFLALLVLFITTGVVMAAEGDTAAAATTTAFFSPGIAMGVAAGLCGIGQGMATSAACEGIARNPAAVGDIRTTLIIGLALIESLALYTLVVVFVKS